MEAYNLESGAHHVRRLAAWLGFVFAVVVAGVVGYKIGYPTHTYRYRMTVNVEVDGQMRSGSSVIEVKVIEQPAIIINPIQHRTKGEAVFIDLGGQRSLVALLASGEAATNVNFPDFVVPQQFRSELKGRLASLPSLRGSRELDGKNLPTLVTFSDPNNSATWRVIHYDQLEQVFGRNVHWRNAVIEMTNDPVTRSLEARLPFIASQRDALRNPIRDSNKFTPALEVFLRND
jgi:hypothetical protein